MQDGFHWKRQKVLIPFPCNHLADCSDRRCERMVLAGMAGGCAGASYARALPQDDNALGRR